MLMTKIYTKAGDNGYSKNLKGKSYPKSDLLFEVVGTLDELNAVLGLISLSKKKTLRFQTGSLQSYLFTIGSFFASGKVIPGNLNWLEKQLLMIEKNIDEIDAQNISLKNFILPSGSYESSHLHLARTVCRRLERLIAKYLNDKGNSSFVPVQKYINRLSDYLFVLARFYNQKGRKDVIWRPTAIR